MSEGNDKHYFLVAYLQWQMVGWVGVIAMRFVFGQLFYIHTKLASSCKIVRASCSTHADGAKMAMSSA